MNLWALLLRLPAVPGYLVVGGLVMLESLGLPVPGETALITASLLSAHQASTFVFWGVGLAGAIGAIVGDSLGFAIGRRWGDRLLDALSGRFPRHVTRSRIVYIRHLVGRYGARVVFAGRFVTLLRMLAGPIAGSMGLPYRRFLVANVLGALLWAFGISTVVWALGGVAGHWLHGIGWVLAGAALVASVFGSRWMSTEFDRRADDLAAVADVA